MIVQTGPIARDVEPLGLAALQPALDGLGHRDRLRHGEGDGRVDADAAVGGLLHRADAGLGGRDLHDDVGRQGVELDRLRDQRVGVAVEPRVGLHREPAVAAAVLGEGVGRAARRPRPRAPAPWPSRCRTPTRWGARRRTRAIRCLPARQVAAQRGQRDDRVAGRADRAPADRGGQLGQGRRVVPQPGRGAPAPCAGAGRRRRRRGSVRPGRSSRRPSTERTVGAVRGARTAPTAGVSAGQPVTAPTAAGCPCALAGSVRLGSGESGAEQAAEGLVDLVDRLDHLEAQLAAVLHDLHDVGRLDRVAVGVQLDRAVREGRLQRRSAPVWKAAALSLRSPLTWSRPWRIASMPS